MFGNLRLVGLAAVAACVLAGWSSTGTAGAQSACNALGGTVDSGQVCHAQNATPTYKIDFSFPVDYPDQQPLADYLTQQRDGFVKWVQSPAAQNSPRPPELLAQGTTYRSSGTESLVLQMGQDSDPHPVAWYKVFNYDLNKHAPITFDTLFRPGTNPLQVLNSIMDSKFGPQPNGDPGVDAYQNFAITDDAVIFFFDQGQMLSHAAGPQQVSVPRTELASLMAEL